VGGGVSIKSENEIKGLQI
jgi:hypothetical protein